MKLKPGARLIQPQPRLIEALHDVDILWHILTGHEVTVTSGDEGYDGDGVHKTGSFHYKHLAADLRVWDLPKTLRPKIRPLIAWGLGTEWDVIDEKDHLHLEYDP